MKIEKVVCSTQEQDLEITEVTLLSDNEYMECVDRIPAVNGRWWLRSPGNSQYNAAYVLDDGLLCSYDANCVDAYVRPALKISNLTFPHLQIGDRFCMAGYTWTVIGEGLALCDQLVGCTVFREDRQAKDANDYEASDVKKWLAEWARNNGIKTTDNQAALDGAKLYTVRVEASFIMEIDVMGTHDDDARASAEVIADAAVRRAIRDMDDEDIYIANWGVRAVDVELADEEES